MYKIVTYYQEDDEAIENFRQKSRYMWTDHISYTRDHITSHLAGLDDLVSIDERLMKNQDDLGELLSMFYGSKAAEDFAALLKSHIIGVSNFITAAKAGQDTASAMANMDKNTNDIVALLEATNSVHWPAAMVRDLWSKHVGYTMDSIKARMDRKWADDIAAYDANHLNILKFADTFCQGIVMHNIEKFSK